MTANPNTFWRVLGRLAQSMLIVFSLPVVALLISPYSHLTAQVLANAWVFVLFGVITMRRPPADYGSYTAWWLDRDNWWVAYPS